MLVVQGEELCSISDPQTSQKLIVLCYTFIFSFHVRCLFELNMEHMKKGNALQNLLGIPLCQKSIYMKRPKGF